MTHASHFDGDTLTLTSPRGTLVLSQGQCASIVIMAEKYGPVGRVREAHRPAEVCKLCGGTYEECQHKRCYGFVNGDRKPAAQGDEDKLRAWSIGYEYYYDAYFGPDAPFGNQQPTAATLAEVLQAGARLVPLVIMAKDAEIASLREKLAEAQSDAEGRKRFEQWYKETLEERDQKTEECGFYLQDRNRLAGELGLANTLRDNALAERDRLAAELEITNAALATNGRMFQEKCAELERAKLSHGKDVERLASEREEERLQATASRENSAAAQLQIEAAWRVLRNGSNPTCRTLPDAINEVVCRDALALESAHREIAEVRQALGDALGKDYLCAKQAVQALASDRDRLAAQVAELQGKLAEWEKAYVILALAVIGLVASIVGVVVAVEWLVQHVRFA